VFWGEGEFVVEWGHGAVGECEELIHDAADVEGTGEEGDVELAGDDAELFAEIFGVDAAALEVDEAGLLDFPAQFCVLGDTEDMLEVDEARAEEVATDLGDGEADEVVEVWGCGGIGLGHGGSFRLFGRGNYINRRGRRGRGGGAE